MTERNFKKELNHFIYNDPEYWEARSIMYNDDDSTPSFFILIAITSIFFVGYGIGFTMGEQFSQKETINFCVEQPSACKVKYDYYKLENQK